MGSLAVALAVVGAAADTGRAHANGGVVEIFRGTGGAYEIALGVLPEEAAVGAVHFAVTVSNAETPQPVTDAEVVLVAVDESGRPEYQARALNTPDEPLYYDANITFESAGSWTIRVDVNSPGLGRASVDVPLEVRDPLLTPGTSGTLLFVGTIAVLVGGGLFVWRSSTRALRKRGAARVGGPAAPKSPP